MGELFRSEEMALCQLFIQPEAAYNSVSKLGELGAVQFRDLNGEQNSFQRRFVQEVRRCDELERKLIYIETELKKDEVNVPDIGRDYPEAPNPREIIDLEAHLEKVENEILELSQNSVNLKLNYIEMKEFETVLEKAEFFFTDNGGIESAQASLAGDDAQARGQLGFIAGVINRERMPAFERMLWRISRGNIFVRQSDLEIPLEDPQTRNQVYKTAFVAFFQGDQLKQRLKKVCTGFHASLYPCPNETTERSNTLKGLRTRLADLNLVLNKTQDHRQRVLVNVAKEVPHWAVMIKKMKAIYHTLNLFNMDVSKKCLIGECWIPVNDLGNVQKVLADESISVGSTISSFLNVIQSNEVPPTFNRTNRFTKGFQNLIDSYGMASYREVNPALYTIVTFPFLFGIMFGDMGHGLIMLLFALYMVLNEKNMLAEKSTNEIRNIFFSGRYIILLMGIFSIYTGFVYNDVFSKAMNLFGSNWRVNLNETAVMYEDNTLDPTFDYGDKVYPIGLDPVWQLADNNIIFLNSFKMKLSIIFGVVHMIFGVCLSVVNHMHFRNPMNIILEFIPQILFLLLLFAYMVTLMFLKWVLYSAEPGTEFPKTPGCAPSVLILFINMLLFKDAVVLPNCETQYMFEGQDTIQLIFVFIALICIPWLLLAKPIYVMCTKKTKRVLDSELNEAFEPENIKTEENEGIEKQLSTQQSTSQQTMGESLVPKSSSGHDGGHGGGHGDHEDEPISEVFIHQAIHTIEYILSTISHTASYLRLWALSLAHSQLSDVLWGRIFNIGLTSDGYVMGSIMIFITFAVWSFLSIAILVLMEGLSAFLHTLRLHWVEFMSKFYGGLGYAFHPFSFKAMLEGEDEAE